MRAEHLKFFLALAENHSLTKTSLVFDTTHQNVSRMIRQLEDEMDTQLFTRSQKGMYLTPQGKCLMPVAHETLRAFHQVRLDIAQMNRHRDLEGCLMLWSTPIATPVALQSLIDDFSSLYPKVRYHVREKSPIDVLTEVTSHPQALGLVAIMHDTRYQALYAPYLDAVTIKPLFRDEYFCLVSRSSPLARLQQISFKEFACHPIAMVESREEDVGSQPFVQLLAERCHTEPALLTQSRQLYAQSIASGRFVGISSRHTLALLNLFTNDEMVLIPFIEDLSLDIALVFNSRSMLDEVGTAFIAMIDEQVKEFDI